eukprot:CAMPEP_0176465326 /NCGR_PEP_ID=MMETSP0127-20121128/37161_1 /TAXON_ID=938130 /ORGANISM="Platyophrya macrostoma, Strain WH" /LENGTH=76 /DNA_ID=CAMNT_0017858143 /DNA_START=8 /DNA_END=235 /DNA_ORIENTATION=-
MTGDGAPSKHDVEELLSRFGDGLSKTYSTELEAVLQSLPFRLDQAALSSHRALTSNESSQHFKAPVSSSAVTTSAS